MSSVPIDERTRLNAKYNRSIASNAMKHYEEKYGTNPAHYLLSQPKNLNEARTAQDRELDDLF